MQFDNTVNQILEQQGEIQDMGDMAKNMFAGLRRERELVSHGFSNEDIARFWDLVNNNGMTHQQAFDQIMAEKRVAN
jgi:hypothetical protein